MGQTASVNVPAIIRAVIYCRLSRDDDGDMLGVRRQERDARRLCAAKGWTVVEVFLDDDISAWSGRKRPAYQAMLGAITAGDVDAVVAYDLDRLHRLPKELEHFFDVCDHSGLTRMATVAGDVDLASTDGRLVARIMGAVAKKASDDTSRRIKRLFDDKAEAGEPHGARAFGYDVDGTTVRSDEAKFIRAAAKAVLAGESLASIARQWNALGVAPPQRARGWSPTTVRTILTGPHQAGLRRHRGEIVGKGAWPAVIDKKTHERLRALLNDPNRRRQNPPRRGMFTGLFKCGRCGGALVRSSSGKTRSKKQRGPSWVCHLAPGRVNCGRLGASAPTLESLVQEAVLQRFDGVELSAHFGMPSDDADSDDLTALEDRLNELAETWAAGDITRPEWMKARKTIEQRLEAAKRRRARQVRSAVLDDYRKPGALRRAWEKPESDPGALSEDRRRAILAAIIDRVIVNPTTRRGPRFDADRVDIQWRA